MDYQTATKILKTLIEVSFAKTRFPRYELRKQSILWAINLPKGESYEERIESTYYKTYRGSIIKFGKPGKESARKKPNPWDMKPTLYEMRDGDLSLSKKGFDFYEILNEIYKKINDNAKAGHVLLALLYRSGILIDHSFSNNTFSYHPNIEIIKWLDVQLCDIGDTPPSELIAIFDAIMLNEDVKVYLNNEKYQTKEIEPNEPRGRINTMGAVFATCAPEEIFPRIKLADLLIRGRGAPRIFEKEHNYGAKLISPMTGNIVYLPK